MIDKKIKEFEKYKKEYEIKSRPYNYIHEGLDSSFTYSDFKKHFMQVIKDCQKQERERIVEMIGRKFDNNLKE